MHIHIFICKWHNCTSVVMFLLCYHSCFNKNVEQPRCQQNLIRSSALHWICFTKTDLESFFKFGLKNEWWLFSGEMQPRYQFYLDQYFYKFIMLILFCQPLCPVHLGCHIFFYGLFISFRLYFKKNIELLFFLSPPRSHKCQFWLQWIMLLFDNFYLFIQPKEQSVFFGPFFQTDSWDVPTKLFSSLAEVV